MIGTENYGVAAIEGERDRLIAAFALSTHLSGAERRAFHFDVQFFNRRDQHVPSIRFAPEHGREQADHGRASNWYSFMKPGAVAGDTHSRIPAALRMPLVDRRQPTRAD